MPFVVTMRTKLPLDNDGGIVRSLGYQEIRFYFRSRENADAFMDANVSHIRTCERHHVQDAPGPFEDEQ